MAKNNRTEFSSGTTTSFPDASAIKAAALRTQQITNLSESARFKKDVIISEDKTGETVISADFSSADTLVFTNVNQNITISVTGLADGERAFIVIPNKAISNTITWGGGIIDNSLSTDHINTKLTDVVYEVVQKNSSVYVVAQSKSLFKASFSEVFAGTEANKYITPETLQASETYLEVGNDGGETSLNSNFVNSATEFNLSYKKDSRGDVWVNGIVKATAATGTVAQTLFNLPSEYLVTVRKIRNTIITEDGVICHIEYDNDPQGAILFNPKSGSIAIDDLITINLHIPKDVV